MELEKTGLRWLPYNEYCEAVMCVGHTRDFTTRRFGDDTVQNEAMLKIRVTHEHPTQSKRN